MSYEEICSELQLFHGIDRADYDRKRKALRFAVTVSGIRLETSWRSANLVGTDFDRIGAKAYSAMIREDAAHAALMIEAKRLDCFGAWGLVR